MLKESVARRYSAALFALASEADAVKKTAAELDGFVALLHDNAELATFWVSPVVGRDVKQRIMTKALRKSISDLTLNFLVLLARKRRENILDIVARQMHDMYEAEMGRQAALIETPRRLSAEELAELARRLSKVYQRKLVPQQKVDPALLGGVTVQVGDKFVDATVAGRLEEMRRHLLAGGEAWGAGATDGTVTK